MADASEPARRTPKIKLQPPRRPATYVWRPRLEHLLDSADERRLTTVVAGPGFGKSTLVASRALEHGWAWYGADSSDAALGVFARGLREALFLAAGEAAIPEEAFRADAEGLAASFGQVLDATLAGDVVLVVDDVHELGAESESARLLEGLSRQAPAELHLVLCSREEAPFPTERLQGQGQAVRIDSSALAFTAEEVEVLLLDVSPELAGIAADLHDATGGWPAAVQLGAHMLATAPPDSQGRSLSALERRGGPLFSYLAEEVLRLEPPEVIELLRTIAPFERFTPELCAALGLPDPAVTLFHLEKRGFISIGDDKPKWLRLHPLLRDFVLGRWPMGDEQRRLTYRTAACWVESKGSLPDALVYWREAEEPHEIVRLLSEHRVALLDGGYVDAVLDMAAVVPDELLDLDAKLAISACHNVRGDKEAELRYLREFVADGAESNRAVSFYLGNRYLLEGRYQEAIKMVLAGDEIPPFHLAFGAYAYFSKRELKPSRECATRALAAARESGHLTAEAEARNVLGEIAIEEGDLAAAETHIEIALETAQRAENVLSECSGRTRMALVRLAQGRYDDALVAADECIGLAERIGFAVFLAWALMVRGQVQYRLGRLDEAAVDLAVSAARYERLGSDRNRAWALARLGESHRERGDLPQARAACETALALGEKSEDPLLHASALAGVARIIAGDEPDRAAELAERAVRIEGGSRGELLLTRGWVALSRQDTDAAAADAASALAAAIRLGRREQFAEALELQSWSGSDARPLNEALAIWRELGRPISEARVELALAVRAGSTADALRLRKRLRSLGVRDGAFRAAGPLMEIGEEAQTAVVIQTLGGFNVLLSGQPVSAAAWKSKKARDLLKLLVSARGRPLTRQQLIEALWPGEPVERTGNRLSVALSTVRAVLDSDRSFDQSHFVAAEEGTVRLRLDHVVVDIETFLAGAEVALRAWREKQTDDAREQLEEAEQSYAGDFLTEDLYEPWASALREEARGAYADLVRALADATQGREATRYYLRILEADPFDEQAHIGLIAALLEAGAHGEARRAYGAYVGQMARIGVEPVPLAGLTRSGAYPTGGRT